MTSLEFIKNEKMSKIHLFYLANATINIYIGRTYEETRKNDF